MVIRSILSSVPGQEPGIARTANLNDLIVAQNYLKGIYQDSRGKLFSMMLTYIISSRRDSLGRYRIDIRKKSATGRVTQVQTRLPTEAVKFQFLEVFIACLEEIMADLL